MIAQFKTATHNCPPFIFKTNWMHYSCHLIDLEDGSYCLHLQDRKMESESADIAQSSLPTRKSLQLI
jgi:hypothetical protein